MNQKQHQTINKYSRQRKTVISALFFTFLLTPLASHAVDMDDLPATVHESTVIPNIMFVFDDSWSMRWEVLYNEGSATGSGSAARPDPQLLGDLRTAYLHPGAAPDFHSAGGLGAETRSLCRGYNKLAYDPRVTYEPWDGWPMQNDTTLSNTEFQDKTLATALYYPYRPNNQSGNSATCNMNMSYALRTDAFCRLTCSKDNNCSSGNWDIPTNIVQNASGDVKMTDHVYYQWEDADNDGQYDKPSSTNASTPDECGFYGEGNFFTPFPTNAVNYGDDIDGTNTWQRGKRKVTDLPADRAAASVIGIDCTDDSESNASVYHSEQCVNTQQNYANWWTYYRRRLFTAYGAFAKFVMNTKANIGIYVIGGDGTAFGGYNGKLITAPVDVSEESGKKEVLKAMWSYAIGWGLKTPLRRGTHYGCQQLAASGTESCQHNIVFVMTDGVDNVGVSGPGNADGDNLPPFKDTYSNTLADVAMYWYEQDLNGSTNRGDLPPFGRRHPQDTRDEPTEPHIRTSILSFGLGLQGSFFETTLPPGGATDWPMPVNDDAMVKDMMHAALNGAGKYYSADTPDEVIAAVEQASRDINKNALSSTSISATSSTLTTSNRIFVAGFTTGTWSGEVKSLAVNISGANVSTTTSWSASNNIPEHGSRVIYTGVGNLLFDTSNAALKTSPAPGLSNDQINYLRGDRSKEENLDAGLFGGSYPFRERDSLLGPIINSSPVYVSAPNQNFDTLSGFPAAFQTSYQSFKSTQSSRIPVVYAGSNDGMLHAFRASDGVEMMAYVPGLIVDKLIDYPSKDYEYFALVDGSITTGDYYDGGWKTLLVGSLRNGAKGVYALDITNPTLFGNTANAGTIRKWEFSGGSNSSDMGNIAGDSLIIPVKNGSGVKWQVIIPNGYNSSNGRSGLFVVNPGDGSLSQYLQTSSSSNNGLSSPAAIDVDKDGLMDYMYAGDLRGQLWRFKYDTANNNWGAPQLIFDAGNNRPITTRPTLAPGPVDIDSDSNKLDDGVMVMFGTGQLLNKFDANSNASQAMYGIWDYKFQTNASSTSAVVNQNKLVQQSIIYEDPSAFAGGTIRVISNNEVTYSDADDSNPPTHYGWYTRLRYQNDGLNLNDSHYGSAERIIWNPKYIEPSQYYTNGRLIMESIIPKTDPGSTSICENNFNSFFIEVDPYSGGPLDVDEGVFDINNDGIVNLGDTVTINGVTSAPTGIERATPNIGETTVFKNGDGEAKCRGTVSGGVDCEVEKDPSTTFVPYRSSWRQLKL